MLKLHSAELDSVAELLEASAHAITTTLSDRENHWQQLSQHSNALSFIAGFKKLHQQGDAISHTALAMFRASAVLYSTADLVRLLERWVLAVDRAGDYSFLKTNTLNQIAMLTDLLDFMCAREINALYASSELSPSHKLADFAELSAAAIHEYHLIHASPEIQELSLNSPDLTFLEVANGSLVVAIGDLDSASVITTIVAGVGSSDPEQWFNHIERSRSVHHATGSATILWLGYPAPESIGHAVSGRIADAAGSELREFQQALHHRNPDQQHIVVGYSYGSLVAGSAASEKEKALNTDALVLVGSPGIGVDRASDLHLTGTNPSVYAVTGSADLIGLAATGLGGIHGVDPVTELFGAEVWDSDSDHSGYWTDKQFLTNMTALVNSMDKN